MKTSFQGIGNALVLALFVEHVSLLYLPHAHIPHAHTHTHTHTYTHTHSLTHSHTHTLYECIVRDRWVYYARKDYDASQVPPEW